MSKSSVTHRLVRETITRLLVLASVLVLTAVSSAVALSPEQRRVINSGSLYYNIAEGDQCLAVPPSGVSGSVYILGDSITHAAVDDFQRLVPAAGMTLASINSDPGRAISLDTGGGDPTGLEAVDADQEILTGVGFGAIVIALGTNSGTEDLNVQIPALIQKVRSYNTTARIFWVNLFYTGDSRDERNQTIESLAGAQGYTVIDTTEANIPLQEDGTHPTVEGNDAFASTVVNGMLAAPAPTASGGAYDPISLNFPSFPNEGTVAAAMTSYVRSTKPNSPWLGINNGNIGEWLMAGAKNRNINPLLIFAIGKQENQFGTTNQTHVTDYYNYFGMKGDDPIDIPGSDYKGFNSPEDGITYFMDKVKTNTQGPDRGLYTEVQNFYDYVGMHQAGQIKYPGESLGTYNGGTDGFDPSMEVYISWTTTDHPNNRYDGQLFNPGIYYANSVNLINELTGSNLSTTPTPGPTSASTSGVCASNSSGQVSPNGYAWPLAPQTRTSYSGIPCGEYTCHHDETPAADLSYDGVTGQNVYAIIGGRIDKVGVQEAGWCQSVQLEGTDGFYYWYGHIIDVSVAEGDTVEVGQQIAKVAEWTSSHTCNGTSGGAHLHIDRGCTINGEAQRGGSDDCRDPDFIPLLNAIYDSLPS